MQFMLIKLIIQGKKPLCDHRFHRFSIFFNRRFCINRGERGERREFLDRITGFTEISFSPALVFLADFACKASFVANFCLRPPGSLRLPTYDEAG